LIVYFEGWRVLQLKVLESLLLGGRTLTYMAADIGLGALVICYLYCVGGFCRFCHDIYVPDLAANIIGDGAQNVGHGQQEEESTSGVSTFDSSNRPPDLSRLDRSDSQRDLLIQIRDLEDENKR